MTTNPAEIKEEAAPPLTPGFEENGKVQFLGPDCVKYISPPRNTHYNRPSPPPPYPSYQPSQCQMPMPMQMCPPQVQMAPPMPMYMQPTFHQPQMMFVPPMPPQAYMMQPTMMAMPQAQPVVAPAPPPAPAPSINVVVNSSPTSLGGPGGTTISGGGALVCPKCRKGILTRQQDRKRKKMLYCLAICCCPITCGLPLFWLCCNFVDTCACCGKQYGHRGRKAAKNKVGAVKL